jgi:hypothetical protein
MAVDWGDSRGPRYLAYLARAYADLVQFDPAWRCIDEAMTSTETSKQTLFEAEVHRTAGELALMSAEHDATKAEYHFKRSLAVARQ